MPGPPITPGADCTAGSEPGLLSIEDARSRILGSLSPLTIGERLPLRDALRRTLAEDVVSSVNVPGHTNSAMDGYALAGAELPDTASFDVVGSALAGRPFSGRCRRRQCVQIMTGAAMPDGTDTVIMQEHVERTDNSVKIGGNHAIGQNVRQAGEDIAAGARVLTRGRRLMPADLGVVASLGIAEVIVMRRPRVAFFSTGDELCAIGDGRNLPLQAGRIYDSNRYTLHGMLRRLNVEIIDMGIVKDNPDDVRHALLAASRSADMVITSGGVSVGEADYIKSTLEEIGDINFWKIAIKPGRPLAFGRLGNAVFFGLPGNPVSVMVTFYQLVQPVLRYLTGAAWQSFLSVPARCTSNLRKRPGRFEFQRGILEQADDGGLSVSQTGDQGSGILTSMSQANCFILLDEKSADVKAGSMVMVQPFELFM